jgi:ribosomal protein S18 acetylase RimI-like enzyme
VNPRGREGIRRASIRDLDQLTALWRAINAHHSHLDPLFTDRSEAGAEARELLRAQLADADMAFFVSERAGELVGFCAARIDRAPPILVEVERAQITDLFVAPGMRRKGLARALVAAALAWVRARRIERVEVRVARGNHEGQAFWRSLGFTDLMDVLHRRL